MALHEGVGESDEARGVAIIDDNRSLLEASRDDGTVIGGGRKKGD